MKIIQLFSITLVFMLSFSIHLNAQQFTKIIFGDLVNTPSGSRSCNFLDLNNDDFQDILITNGKTGGENNMLYVNNGNGTFTLLNNEVSSDGKPSDGASCADVDNDGFIDVFAANWYNENNLLYLNNGDASFSLLDTSMVYTNQGYSETGTWGDYNQDGLVDLYVTNSAGSKQNFLYQNMGAGYFQRITGIVPATDAFFSRCVNWIDYDEDGDQDLFVTNENDQNNNLYRNDGNGIFTKLVGEPQVSDNFSSISSSWDDYDNDGDFDLFIANYEQNNQLFQNDGSGNFTSVSGPWSTETGCSFSSSFGDYDNDGDLDLFVTNGFCANDLNNYLYENNGDGTFTKNIYDYPAIDTGASYGCAWGDYNNDGFLDLLVANWQNETQENYLYMNNANANYSLQLALEGTISNRSAIGAIIKCKATINGNPVWLKRHVSAQTGYCSQNSLVVHFGLGDDPVTDSLQIIWPSGIIQNFTNVANNTYYKLIENGELGILGVHETSVKKESVMKIYPNPANSDFTIELNMLKGEKITIQVLTMSGQEIFTQNITVDSDSKSVEIRNLNRKSNPGIYLVNLIVDKEILSSQKISIGQ